MKKTERAGIRDIAEKIPLLKIVLSDEVTEPGQDPCEFDGGIMFDFIVNRNNSRRKKSRHKISVPRPNLYCVWLRAHDGENAPPIRVWIDPSLSMFDSQARVHEPDLAAARAEPEAALSREGNS